RCLWWARRGAGGSFRPRANVTPGHERTLLRASCARALPSLAAGGGCSSRNVRPGSEPDSAESSPDCERENPLKPADVTGTRRKAERQASTLIRNPPYAIRFMSNGIDLGSIIFPSRGSFITFLFTWSRCAFDL